MQKYEQANYVLEDLRKTIEDVEDSLQVVRSKGTRSHRFQKTKFVGRHKKFGTGNTMADLIGTLLSHSRFTPVASTTYQPSEFSAATCATFWEEVSKLMFQMLFNFIWFEKWSSLRNVWGCFMLLWSCPLSGGHAGACNNKCLKCVYVDLMTTFESKMKTGDI